MLLVFWVWNKGSPYTKVLKVHRHCSLPALRICQRLSLNLRVMDPVGVVSGQTAMKEIGYRKAIKASLEAAASKANRKNEEETLVTWSLPLGKNPQPVRHFEPARGRSASRAPDLRCRLPRAPMDIGLSSDHNRSGKGFPNSSYPRAWSGIPKRN